MASVTLDRLYKRYDGGNDIVRDVSLEIADGEFCVFVGPSGCGKSTLLRMIAGLEDITQGALHIGKQQVNDLAPSERNVAMVFQNYALYPHLDVAQNISFGLKLAGMSGADIRARVNQIAKVLEIGHLLDRKPRALSGGQRQRVAIGRALVRNPGVFLFDEPLSNLDAALRTQTRLEIARMHREYGRASTIYVTHDQVEAMTLGDKIVLLHAGDDMTRHGSVAQVGAPMDLYQNPRNLFVARFIGSPQMNLLTAQVMSIDHGGPLLGLIDGTLVKAAVRPDGLAAGTQVTLGIRSEHLSLCEPGGQNIIAGRIQWVEKLGDTTFAYVDTAHQRAVVVRLPGESPVTVGDAVGLRLPADRLHVFGEDGMAVPRLPA
jgi:multiple sugar transport system ATP-binding protein